LNSGGPLSASDGLETTVSQWGFYTLNWRSQGYHGFPITPGRPDYVSAENAATWSTFETLLEEAKQGHFERMPEALDEYDNSDDWVLKEAFACLMGDAGTRVCIEKLIRLTKAMIDPSYQVDFCKILGAWGNLSAVPLLLMSWEKLEGYDDREDIPDLLSHLLEPRPGPIADLAATGGGTGYHDLVTSAHHALCTRLGTDNVIVLHGELFSVKRLCRHILEALAHGTFEPYMRRKLEATTGVDCTGFYHDGNLDPLGAAAIVESVLHGPHLPRYADGVRYFFGHRLDI
jgi:hypothetical protein